MVTITFYKTQNFSSLLSVTLGFTVQHKLNLTAFLFVLKKSVYKHDLSFQSKLNPEIDPTCRLCLQANETLHHLMTDCEATTSVQLDKMKNQIPLPDMTWSVKDINKFIQHPLIHSLMTYDTQYNNREIEYIDHNYSSDASSL